MRVLQLISPTGFYGAERWILALARHLGEHDVSCDLAVTSEDTTRRFELLDRFPRDNGSAHRIEMSHRFDLSSVTRLRQLIDERDIDLVHTHGYKSDFLGWLAARREKVPCISTPHGYGHGTDLKLKLLVQAGGRILRRHDRVVPLSRQLLDETLQLGVSSERCTLIGNGVDLVEITSSGIGYTIDTSRPGSRLGYVGQVIPRKRIHELVEIFNVLWLADPSRTLEIAGDGAARAHVESLAATLPCAEAITFHGFVEDRLRLMATFDLFVMTSEEEGIPRVLMEAQGVGIPVAAYDIDGVNDLIIDGETGLLAPLGDRDALAAQCELMLKNRAQTAAIAANGRSRVHAEFSAERMAREYASLYSDLLERQ